MTGKHFGRSRYYYIGLHKLTNSSIFTWSYRNGSEIALPENVSRCLDSPPPSREINLFITCDLQFKQKKKTLNSIACLELPYHRLCHEFFLNLLTEIGLYPFFPWCLQVDIDIIALKGILFADSAVNLNLLTKLMAMDLLATTYNLRSPRISANSH